MGGTKIYKSTSIKGKKPVLHKSVQRILNFIPKRHRSNGHGSCGLPVCLTEALNDKVDVRGSRVAAYTIARPHKPTHLRPWGAFISCAVLTRWFGLLWAVREVKGK